MTTQKEALETELPCAVHLEPSTVLGEGVRLGTLLSALEARGMSREPRQLLTADWADNLVRVALQREQDEWYPIETAPKDGTEILVYCSDTREQFVALWTERFSGWQFAIGPNDGPHICRPSLWTYCPPNPPKTDDSGD